MYDFCIIGSGIVGKYIAHQLQKRNILWISGHSTQYTSVGEYQLGHYVGGRDTWQDKAAGLISFPSPRDIATFPFSWKQYKVYERALKHELNLHSLQSLCKKPEYARFVGELESIFPSAALDYFWSGHTSVSGPTFSERDAYENYWHTQKSPFSFAEDKSEYMQAEYFILKDDRALALVVIDKRGRRSEIAAKRFMVACHTPATIALLDRTFAHNSLNARKYLGRYYADHAQTSLGLLLPDIEVPRTTLTSFCYQDRIYQDIPYRLEFHIAPPRLPLIHKTRMRLAQYSQQTFERSFMRVTVVYHLPPSFSSRLQLVGKDYSTAKVSEIFLNTLRKQRKQLLPYITKQFLRDSRVVLLNQHFPFFFAGHLTGGASFPYMVDEHFSLHAITNVSIAGCSTFPTSGLFNPTFTALVCAKHLLARL